MGEWVDSDVSAPAIVEPPRAAEVPRLSEPDVVHGGWVESSFDLLRGLEVTELPRLSADDASVFNDDGWADTQFPEHP